MITKIYGKLESPNAKEMTTYPINVFQLRDLSTNVSWSNDPDDTSLREHGYVPVVSTEPPTVHRYASLVENPPICKNGIWYQTWGIQTLDLETARNEERKYIAAYRYEKEIDGVNL
jgi:hypothetical protein